MGDRQEQTATLTEREFTGALVRLISGEERTVYFLTGHGELSPEGTDEQNYSQVTTTLENKNYIVNTLNLLSTNQIPADADLIVVAGARHPLAEEEIALLSDYVDQGGALMVLAEPLPLTEIGDQEDQLARYLADTWGITLGADIIVDQTSSQPFVVYADQYSDHLVTQKMQRVGTAFPTARSIQVDAQSEQATLVELILTANQSWAETDLEAVASGAEITLDEAEDRLGPLTIAVAGERSDTGGRVIVFGDAEFASNVNFGFLGNGDMFVNSIDWAVGQEELINLTPRTTTQRYMLPPQPYVMNLILLGVVFVLPGGVLASGVVVWVRRRRRG
jgi:ABC-type uncharacterized transport system involved in gliding motility auxiliary subunit